MNKMIECFFKEKLSDAIIAILCAFMLISIGIMHTRQHISSPVTIPAAIEMRWASDSSWTGGWK